MELIINFGSLSELVKEFKEAVKCFADDPIYSDSPELSPNTDDKPDLMPETNSTVLTEIKGVPITKDFAASFGTRQITKYQEQIIVNLLYLVREIHINEYDTRDDFSDFLKYYANPKLAHERIEVALKNLAEAFEDWSL